MNQSCKVKWESIFSEEFKVKNGVRQGAVLSPTLFSLYIDDLLILLESSGFGCHIKNYYYGSSAYADDIVLMSPSRNGLQVMLDICVEYFNEHEIIISTNENIEKSKTKCIFFSHTKSDVNPASIVLKGVPLPWVDSWPHLGNDLNKHNLCIKAGSNMDEDLEKKRRKFVGKCHTLMQEFGFTSPEIKLKIISIYALSFYGSVLWDYTGDSIQRLYNTWNKLVRNLWSFPNTSHRYFIEEISGSKHLKSMLVQ